MRLSAARRWMLAAGTCGLAAATLPAPACDVPVFRYALERWEADAYLVWVFHRGPLTGDANEALQHLIRRGADRQVNTNVFARAVDLDKPMDPAIAALWKGCPDAKPPWVVACYPQRWGPPVPAWSGALTLAGARRMTTSPAREETARRILHGQSVVWVLLEGGDKAKDDAAAKMLTDELRRLEKTIELPQPVQDAWSSDLFTGDQQGAPDRPPLRAAFSVLRVSRKDAAESFFIATMLGTEEDLTSKEYAGEPMAFPIFGQGRMLAALVGKGITADNIADMAAFLCGQCSCQVKEQNPGTDMLFTADWTAIADGKPAASPLPEAIAAPTGGAEKQAPSSALGAAPAADRRRGAQPMVYLYGAIGAVAGIIAIASIVAVVVVTRASRRKSA